MPNIPPDESALEAARKKNQAPTKVTDASVLSEELLMAGSTAKQAEVAAKQIYRIRESRMNILTGDADNLPPDGEAMKLVIQQLEEQEKALTNLFTGIRAKEVSDYEVTIVPFDNLDKEVLFRFSPIGNRRCRRFGRSTCVYELKSHRPRSCFRPERG